MKKILVLLSVVCIVACNSSTKTAKTFCETTCMKDTLKFTKEDHKLKPYVYISAVNCLPDSVTWSYSGLGINRKLSFTDLSGTPFPIDKKMSRCFFNDTTYAYLLFNDCSNGRGYFVKIPFDKKKPISRKGSAINNFDEKFVVADEILAYTDKGNIFVEEMSTGKKAMMTFGSSTDMDYDAMHEVLDSVNITTSRIWAKVKIDKEWKTMEKNITLE